MDNPYKLPEGHVQICFSGGRTSAYLLHQVWKNNTTDDLKRVKVVFANTGREMPETLDFVNRCGQEWGIPIVWLEYTRVFKYGERNILIAKTLGVEPAKFQALWITKPGFKQVSHNQAARNGEPFMELIRAKKYLPNVATRFCTIELKIRTAKRYLLDCGWLKWQNALGIRADEPRRIKPADQLARLMMVSVRRYD